MKIGGHRNHTKTYSGKIYPNLMITKPGEDNFTFLAGKSYDGVIEFFIMNYRKWARVTVWSVPLRNITASVAAIEDFNQYSPFKFMFDYRTYKDAVNDWSITKRRVLIEKSGNCI